MNPNCLISNRNFEHPSDGWYQIEAKGLHPNKRAGVMPDAFVFSQSCAPDPCPIWPRLANPDPLQKPLAGLLATIRSDTPPNKKPVAF
jgi:hypothetical protein